ncbi:MFS transporter [Streptomyces sp. BR123]|uniref:MFS transporter n=1 Tax=Streptomyces sp. BR123 TaxID=2749828 RepID=UPI00211AE936|nr:MFS transporter [Streptomyces sp. BR123]
MRRGRPRAAHPSGAPARPGRQPRRQSPPPPAQPALVRVSHVTSSASPSSVPIAVDRSPWRSLRYPSMRWWSVANLVSNVGTWMQLTVQNLLVLQLTGSAAATGLSMSVQAAPGLLMGLAGGAAVDRWPRKLTAVVSQALLGAVAFTMALLVALDQLNLGVLMVLAAVTGMIATVDGPACALLGNDLVRPEDVPSAIGVGSLVHNAGRLAGAALGAVVVGLLGTAAAYTANGLSFLFVAAVIPFLKPAVSAVSAGTDRKEAGTGRAPAPAEQGLRQGLAFFLRRRRLVALAGIGGLSALFGRNYGLTLVVLVTGPLAGDAAAFGAVSTVLAVGGVVGAVLGARLRRPTVRLVGILAAGGALLQVVAGLSPSLAVLLVLVLPMAVAESVSETATTTLLQTDPPAHLRGRVLGVWGTVRTVWGLAAPATLGLLMELAGARGALVLGGLVVAAVLGSGCLVQSRRMPASVVMLPEDKPAVAGRPGLDTAA